MNYELRIKKLLKIIQRIFFPLKNLSPKKRRALTGIALLVLLITIPLSIYILRHAGISEAAWFNDNWGYRKSIAVSNSSGGTLTNFQVKILDNKDLSADITAGKIKSDLGDLRFTDINGKLLPYWIEDITASSVDAWILIPTIPTSGATIYMYYGNPSAVNANNIKGMTTGGTVTTISGYRIHTFINSRTFTAGPITNVDYLVVGGGGGGGGAEAHPDGDAAGGGGAGGYREATNFGITNQSYNITVGTGGNGATSNSTDGNNGGDSVFSTITATGGGYGAKEESTGGSGGSGGGGGGTCGAGDKVGGNGNTPSTSPSQGYNGGTGVYDGCYSRGGAGGGGSSAVGANNISGGGGGNGGTGTNSTITGSSVARAGGGGGGMGYDHGGAGVGVGQAGGGNGGTRPYGAGNNATSNSGSGGGGGGSGSNIGGNGGSGIIIIRYAVATEPSSASPSNEEKSPAPVLYLKFDEGTGTVANDSSSNQLNGTIAGATWQTDNQCISGKCLYFNGLSSGNKVDLGTSTKLNPANFAVSAWIKTSDASLTYNYIFSNDRDSGGTYNGFSLFVQGGKLTGLIWNSTATGIVSNSNIPSNQWVHVTFTYDGSNMKLYINGVLDKTVSYAGGVGSPASFNASVGTMGNGQGTYTFKGYIDEFKLYSYARTASQIKTDYSSRGSVKGVSAQIGGSDINKNLSNGLVGYWKMDESSANTCSGGVNDSCDSSGNGRDAAWAGSATSVNGKFGYGATSNAASASITVASPYIDIGTSWTIATWFKTPLSTIDPNWRTLTRGNANDHQVIVRASDGHLGSYDNAGAGFVDSGYVITNLSNGWHHLAAVAENGVTKFYIDGVQVGSSNFVSTTDIQSICSYWGQSQQWGDCDEFRIYNRSLSPAEVSQLYNFAPGPVAYYNFEEGNGNSVNDISGNGVNGSWNGTGTTHWTQGKYGKAGNFVASNSDYVSINSGPTLNHRNVTYSLWIKESASIYGTFMIGKSGYAGYLRDDGSGNYVWDLYDGSEHNVSTVIPSFNQWHYVTGTYDGVTQKIYVDGVLKNSQSISITPYTTTDFGIGACAFCGPGQFTTGQIDEVKVYNYARTAKQIVSDMNAGHPNVGSPVGSPLGYWKFDEGYGTTADNSGNGGATLNGNLYSTTWSNDGKFGKALSFDGTSSYVNAGNSSSLDVGGGDFTASAWIYPTTTAGKFFLQKSDLNDGWLVGLNYGGSNRIYLEARENGTTNSTSLVYSTTIQANTWYYVTVVKIGVNITVYKNGVSLGTQTAYQNLSNSSVNFQIGRVDWWSPGYFQGLIDEVKLYSYALTTDEIKLDMNHGASEVLGSMSDTSGLAGGQVASNSASAAYCIPGDTATCNSPVGEWNFEEGSGNSVNDISGNGNTGTWNGTLTSQWTKGKIGKAGNFNGTNNEVTTTTSFANPQDFSISVWFKTTVASGKNIVNFEDAQTGTGGGNYDRKIYMGTDGKVYFGWYSGVLNLITSTGTLTDGRWHYAVGTHTSGNVGTFYIDGVLQGTGGNAAQSYTGYWRIGGYRNSGWSNGSDGYFTGQIDSVKISNYARTPAQVAYDYNRGAPVGWWKMDECQGTTANDSSGNGNTGIITIGATGSQTTAGTCLAPTDGTGAWYNGAIGKFNSSMSFDGTDDHIIVNNTNFIHRTNNFTYSWWTKWTGTLQLGSYFENGTWTNSLIIRQENASSIYIYSMGTLFGSWAFTPTVGTWYHLAVVRDGNNLNLYVNGEKTGNPIAFNIDVNPSANLWIGASQHASYQNIKGQMDDVRIYNYALTASQVKQVMNQGAGVRFGP